MLVPDNATRRHPVFADMAAAPSLPELEPREAQTYSLARAVQVAGGIIEGDTLERRYSDAAMRALGSLGRSPGGDFAIPMAALTRAVDTSSSGSAGSNLIFTQPGEFVSPLRARSVALALGATYLPDLPLPAALPTQTDTPAATWRPDNPGSDVAESDPTLDQVPLTAHILTATTGYTRSLFAQSHSSTSVDRIVRDDFAARLGTALDIAAIQGPGGDHPTGILNTSGIGDVADSGGNGSVPTYDDMTALEEAVALASGDVGALGFAATPSIRRLLRKTERATGSGMVWEGNRVLGQRGAVSNNVPSTLSAGTSSGNCHAVIYGNWADLIIATAGAMTITVDPFSQKKQGIIEVTMFSIADVALRHAKSFAAKKDALLA